MIQERRVNRSPQPVQPAKRKRQIGHSPRRPAKGKLPLDLRASPDVLDGVVAVLGNPRADGEHVQVEYDVTAVEVQQVDENSVGTAANFQFVLAIGGLRKKSKSKIKFFYTL